jgi:hypothetical protein
VTHRTEEDVGIVVDVEKANGSSLMTSSHTLHLLKNSPDIYYVFFPRDGVTGPYYTSELKLKSVK